MGYNEVVVDRAHWLAHLPDVVEAVFGSLSTNFQFLQAFGLDASSHPSVSFNAYDWDHPMH